MSERSGQRGPATIETARLRLVELEPHDAKEMVHVLGDEALYAFMGGRPPTLDELRRTYRRLARGHSADGRQEWRNWIARQRSDGRAIGTLQATISDVGAVATIAWVVGTEWQGRGYATEAAGGVMGWLERYGVTTVRASIHPGHGASARVAMGIGMSPTDQWIDGERTWIRAQPKRTGGSGPTTDRGRFEKTEAEPA